MHGPFVQPIMVKQQRKRRIQPCLFSGLKRPLLARLRLTGKGMNLVIFMQPEIWNPLTCSSKSIIRQLVTMEDSSHVSHSVGTLVQPPGATAHYAGLTILHDQQPVAYHPDSDTQPEVSAIMVPSFNDVKAPLNMTASHSTGWATKEEWTKRKTDIKQLYVYEKKKLKEVKHLMESRYGFRATSVPCAICPIAGI